MSTTMPPQVMGTPMRAAPMRRTARRAAVDAPPDMTIYLLGIAAVFACWRLQEIIPGASSLKLPVVTLVMAMGAFFMSRSIADLSRVLQQGPMQGVMLMTALAVLGTPFAIVRTTAAVFLAFDFAPTLLLCLFVAASIRSQRDARWLLGFIVLGGVIFSAYSRKHAYIDNSGRPGGIIYYDANDLALLAATSAAIAFGLAHTVKSKSMRLLWLGCAMLLMATVLWTVSRGAFLAILAFALYIIFSPVMPAAKRGTVITVGAIGMLLVGGKSYLNTMKTMLNPQDDYNFSGKSDNGRGEVWKRGMTYVYSRPIMGAGVRNYTAAEGRSDLAVANASMGKGLKYSRAHNSYLEIAVELGIPGFITFATILILTFKRLHLRSRAGPIPMNDESRLVAYVSAALLTFAVGGIFLSGEYWPMVYLIVGIGCGLTSRPLAKAMAGAAGAAPPPTRGGRNGRGMGRRPVMRPVAPGAPVMASVRPPDGMGPAAR